MADYHPPADGRCIARLRGGDRCPAEVEDPGLYCHLHAPRPAAAVHESAPVIRLPRGALRGIRKLVGEAGEVQLVILVGAHGGVATVPDFHPTADLPDLPTMLHLIADHLKVVPGQAAEPELGTESTRSVSVTTAICANCGGLVWTDLDFDRWSHMVTGDRRCPL